MTDMTLLPLFRAGDGGYHTCRIPALVATTTGTVLAFCEGRRGGGADDVPIDLLLRRSHDGGRTWSPAQMVVSDGDRTCGNPCPVVDETTGDIVLVFCKDNQQIFSCRSSDDGSTWSPPVDISSQTRRPDWSYVGAGPGHGIQLRRGPHSSRLLIPAWADESPGPVTWREPRAGWGKVQTSYAFYSDDGGHSWQIGDKMTHDASDECEAVEVNGGVYMTLRSRHDRNRRGWAFSDDGGHSWTPVAFDEDLPESSCQGSILRLADDSVVHANPASTQDRSRLTLRRSQDDCRTWGPARVLYPGAAAYSDLALAPDQHVLCLFEADDYASLLLARLPASWLTPKDQAQPS